jgi:molecular chaperone IbpA
MRNVTATKSLIDEMFSELNRVAIGFEPTIRRLHDVKNAHTMNSNGYPPYDLEQISENHYRITLAVAGFTDADLDIELHDNQLKITGDKNTDESRDYIHRGIASRAFTRVFHVADHVRVESVALENGLLTLDLFREVPESMRPRKIPISNTKTIEGKI